MRRFVQRRLVPAGMAVSAWVAACSGRPDGDVVNPPGATTGSLTVTVTGLPGSTAATVTVTGPSNFSRSLSATERLSGLAPGIYHVTALSVTSNEGRFVPTPAALTIMIEATDAPAAAVVAYALATGSLTITVSGLPTGVNAAVTLTGPDQFSRSVTTTTTIAALEPGSYRIAVGDVTSGDNRFASAPGHEVIVVAGATPAASAVVYALSTGRLTVTVSGLPAGFRHAAGAVPVAAVAAVTVSGPDGYTRTITASTALVLLKPGDYTVSASSVSHGGFTYRPAPSTLAVTVAASTTPATASVLYAASDGALTITATGLPLSVNAAISVSGPGGFSQQLTATMTLSSLAPGAYTIVAVNVTSGATTYAPTPASQVATVVAGSAVSATVSYAAPVALRFTQVATGLERPVHLMSPPSDSRLFVVEQTGMIRIIQNGQLVLQPFLDLSSRILPVSSFGDEHGLLGLAFHPQFGANGAFFVFYVDPGQDLVVERYSVSTNPNIAIPTGTVVLRVPHEYSRTHNGGGLAFGPDGFLYISIGDGGCCGDPEGNAQNLNTLLGKVLRLDVNTTPYSIPSSNPFVGHAGRRGEIWASGLRNPWRMAVDAVTSVLYVADVGEDRMEEVNAESLTAGGSNFGWRIMEGSQCFQQPGCSSQGLVLPVIEYSHTEGCAITGGFAYRGTQIPELRGHYFYSDWCGGFLRSFLLSNGTATQKRDWNITFPGSVTSFGQDANGELYVLTQQGTVLKIVRQ